MSKTLGRVSTCTMVVAGMIAGGCMETAGRAQTAPADWKIYRSPDYGFTIEYPSDGVFTPGYRIDPQRSMIPVCDETSVACFEYNGDAFKGTVIESLGVSVNVLAECNDIDTEHRSTTTVMIHGTRFQYTEFGDAATGHSEEVHDYRTFHQHACFEVALVTAQSDIGPEQYEEAGIHPIDENALRTVQEDMSRMLQSFVFSGPVGGGAAWISYENRDCAARYEVPAGARIEEVLPYSPGSLSSASANCTQSFAVGDHLYIISEKWDFANNATINDWLAMSAYPGLAHARKTPDGTLEYIDSHLAYRMIRGKLILFAFSDASSTTQRARRNRVFTHLVKSFRCP
jgi:hypothetical protein